MSSDIEMDLDQDRREQADYDPEDNEDDDSMNDYTSSREQDGRQGSLPANAVENLANQMQENHLHADEDNANANSISDNAHQHEEEQGPARHTPIPSFTSNQARSEQPTGTAGGSRRTSGSRRDSAAEDNDWNMAVSEQDPGKRAFMIKLLRQRDVAEVRAKERCLCY